MAKLIAKPIVIRGFRRYEGYQGLLLGLVSSSDQGEAYLVAISPDGLEPFTKVCLPAESITPKTGRLGVGLVPVKPEKLED